MYTLTIGAKRIPDLADLAAVSAAYVKVREARGFGASKMPNGAVYQDGHHIGYVSYNGRVWAGMAYDANAKPIYDNRGVDQS